MRQACKLVARMATIAAGAALVAAATGPGAFAAVGSNGAFVYQGGWAPAVNYNPFANSNAFQLYLQGAPLAYFSAGPSTYTPNLASSWKLRGTTLTVHLRNAKWSNGQPVTATDVIVTFELGYLQGATASNWTASISAPNPHTVVFKAYQPYALYERYVLTTNIWPASVFAKYVPKNVVTLAKESITNPKALSALTAAAKKLDGLQLTFKQIPVAGPYITQSINSSEAVLVKNPYFWNAAKVHVDKIIVPNITFQPNSVAWLHLQADQTDFSTFYLAPDVRQNWLSKPKHYVALPPTAISGVGFNQHVYPFNNVLVRQALYYAINRKEVAAIDPPYTPVPVPTGMFPQYGDHWIKAAGGNLSQFNPYPYDPKLAAKLLTKAGFKHTSSGWMMPNGKPFTISISVPGPYSDWVVAAKDVADQWTRFGVPTTVKEVDPSLYWTNTYGAQPYTCFWGVTGAAADPDPWVSYDNAFTVATGWSPNAEGVYSLRPNYGWGMSPTQKVPGLGTVSIPKLLASMEMQESPQVLAQQTLTLAKVFNATLPTLPVLIQNDQVAYSTEDVTGWPSKNNPIWIDMPYHQGGLVVWIITGHLRSVRH